MALMLRRLQSAGLDSVAANEIYGSYTTLAVPVFSLVPSLITPISLSLIPSLTAEIARKNGKRGAEVADRAMRMTTLLAIPSAMGISLYARPILSLLFSGQREAIDIAAPLLSVLGISVLFSGIITVTNAILQAHGQTIKPVISMGVGAFVKIILAYWLIGMPEIGAYGAPISTLVCDITVATVNICAVFKTFNGAETERKNGLGIFRVFVRPFAASILAMAVSLLSFFAADRIIGSDALAFMVALTAAVISYVAFAFLTGAVEREDLKEIAAFNKILKIIDTLQKNKKDDITERKKNDG